MISYFKDFLFFDNFGFNNAVQYLKIISHLYGKYNNMKTKFKENIENNQIERNSHNDKDYNQETEYICIELSRYGRNIK